MVGFLHNVKQDQCLNVDDCGTSVIYDGCTTTGGTIAVLWLVVHVTLSTHGG
jgi:hypothetical protein